MDKNLKQEMARLFFSIGNVFTPAKMDNRKHSAQFETDDLKALKSDWDAVGNELGRLLNEKDASGSSPTIEKRAQVGGYSVHAVTSHIINRAMDTNTPIYHRHLHQILFYLQAHWLIHFERPLFKEAILKKKLGPTIPDVYHEYKVFGTEQISFIPTVLAAYLNSSFDSSRHQPSSIPEAEREEMNLIIDHLLKRPYRDLVNHSLTRPIWLKHEEEIRSGKQVPYTDAEIAGYYSSHPEEMAFCYEPPTVENSI